MLPKTNPVQFAVVREDPELEAELIRKTKDTAKVFLIGSGGCTALSLKHLFPKSRYTLLEPNQAQIDLIKKKIFSLQELDVPHRDQFFGVGHEDPHGLNACGNFESLFRGMRQFLYDFVLDRREWMDFFLRKKDGIEGIFSSKYWPVAFELYLSDPILLAMFGPSAIQYAPKGSYPNYFRKVFEHGLSQPGAAKNYFLHHLLLGHYLKDSTLPPYLQDSKTKILYDFEIIKGLAQEAPGYSGFDVISLSNILDWMNPDEVTSLGRKISSEADSGAFLILRQLNNQSDVRSKFSDFVFDDVLSEDLKKRDRSLFYSSIHVGRKIN